jgi:hypothetical protein
VNTYAFIFIEKEMLMLADSIREYLQNDQLTNKQRIELCALRERFISGLMAVGVKPFPTTQWKRKPYDKGE